MAQAQGDAQRFSSLLTEYKKAPQVTRDRLYTEAMQEVYSNVTKVLVDSRQGSICCICHWTKSCKALESLPRAAAEAASRAPAPSGSAAALAQSPRQHTRARDADRSRAR